MRRVILLAIIAGLVLAFAVSSSKTLAQLKEEPHPLLGTPAPTFTLDVLGGAKVNLADLKDKQIVVLDFWATWCPPCRKALPILVEVTDTYKGKGVTFYAVNIQESAEAIKTFLDKMGIKCNVALDKEGDAAKKYLVQGIPQSVVIGKDGTVEAVHIGLAPDLKEEFKKELDTLLAGKSLTKKPAAPEKKAEPAAKT